MGHAARSGKIGCVKPAPFVYHAPESLEEALAILADVGHDGKILAGGQSLVPLLSMRLASPGHIVDINRITELAYVRTGHGVVRIGALARHADVERDEPAAAAQPLVREALRLVAHPVVRNRGTTLGSIVHADPAAEMPTVLALLDGEVEVASSTGRRIIPAADLYLGPLESTIRPDELALEARLPVARDGEASAFLELARRHGDYAVCGVAVVITADDDGAVAQARAAYVGVAGTPQRVDLSEALHGVRFDGADWSAVDGLVHDRVRPDGDIHASADYRRHLAGVLTRQALEVAAQRLQELRAAA